MNGSERVEIDCLHWQIDALILARSRFSSFSQEDRHKAEIKNAPRFRDEEGNIAIRMRLVEIPYALQCTGHAVPLLRAHRTTRKRERRRVCEHDTRISSSDFSFFYLAAARPEVRSGSLLPDVALFYSFLLVGDTRVACLRATRPTSKLWRVSQNFNIALVKIAVVFYRNRYVCVYVCVHTLAVALGRTRVLAMPLPIA